MPNFSHYVNALYHFTDESNLLSIAELGGLYSWAKLREMEIAVPVPGGNDLSHDLDKRFGVDDYVHLCFKNEHPMEWRARQEGRVPSAVFLQIDPGVLDFEGVLFTDDVSNKVGVTPLSRSEANEALDFEVLYERTDWRDPTVKERLLRSKKYEILVPNFIPSDFITNLFDFEF